MKFFVLLLAVIGSWVLVWSLIYMFWLFIFKVIL